jgi:disulfide bond formation protein DsbB
MQFQSLAGARWTMVFLAWLIALVSTAGSLFFSEVMQLAPCPLCWYQRIFMFPLVVVLGHALLRADPAGVRYALPLAVVGAGIALYQCLLVAGWIPQGLQTCGRDNACAQVTFLLAGFINIPMMSLAAFGALIGLLLLALKDRSL